MAETFGSVQKRSPHQIESLASAVRRELGVEQGERLAMQPILEFALDDMVPEAYFVIANDLEMPGAEGRTDWHQPVITISASTYAKLKLSDPRARMTVAHELGHLLMHTRQPIYYYRSRTKDRRRDPEWQATYFAGALLMPANALRKLRTVSETMKRFGVSRGAAMTRAREIGHQLIDDRARAPLATKKGNGMRRTP